MHYILEILFPFIVLLYLIDCIAYVGHQHLLFSSHFGRRFKLKGPGLHPVGLLPISEVFFSHNLPVFLTSTGVYRLPNQYLSDNARYKAQNLHFIAYEDIVKIETDGKAMKVNGKAIIKFPSSVGARQMTEVIRELTHLEPSGRHEKIRTFLDETTHLQEIRASRENRWPLTYVKILSSVLFVNIFGILPLILYTRLSAYVNLSLIVFASVFVYVLILLMVYVVRRKVIGTATGQTILMIIPEILLPVTAMHILKNLTKEMHMGFDYIAIAAALLPSDTFKRLMREDLLRITYAKEETQNAGLRESWSLRESTLYGLLAQTGIELKELFATPKRQDSSAVSYCPLCLNEYRFGVDKCIDCGIYLRQFRES